ncbi:hypothetical protein Tco_0756565 [Tanacetum coccineum]
MDGSKEIQNARSQGKNTANGSNSDGKGNQGSNKFVVLEDCNDDDIGMRLNKEQKNEMGDDSDKGITNNDDEDVIEELSGKCIIENEIEGIKEGNSPLHHKGCRIALGWNSKVVNVNVIFYSWQVMFCLVKSIKEKSKFFCSFVYAANHGKERIDLWKELTSQKTDCQWKTMDSAWRLQFLGSNSLGESLLAILSKAFSKSWT